MKSSKVKNELCPVHQDEGLLEESMEFVEGNPDLPSDMVRQILQGRQERLSGQATE